jgi:hypothetical protein
MDVRGEVMYASTVCLVGSRSSVVLEGGFAEEESNEEGGEDGEDGEDGDEESEKQDDGNGGVEDKEKRGWKKKMSKGVRWVVCCCEREQQARRVPFPRMGR